MYCLVTAAFDVGCEHVHFKAVVAEDSEDDFQHETRKGLQAKSTSQVHGD